MIILSMLCAILYFFGGYIQYRNLIQKPFSPKPIATMGMTKLFWWVALSALVLNTWLLYGWIETGNGQNLALFNVAAFVAFLIAIIVTALSVIAMFRSLTIIIFPIAALCTLVAALNPGDNVIQTGANSVTLAHILLSLVAYSVLSITCVQALALGLQDRVLRLHRPHGTLGLLPAIETMETLLFQMISLGFVLLSLSLLSGWIFLEGLFLQHVVHHTLLSVLAWLVFAGLLWGRYKFGWRGNIAVRWTLLGYFLLMSAYFGSKLVMELMLVSV